MGHTETTAEVIEFARACGQHRPVQLVLNQFQEAEPAVHRLDKPFVLIGRAANCDVRLRHPDVSYRHAYLQIVGGRALCVDLSSRTGTRWKTGPQSCGWIEPGEDVGIGPFEFSYRDEDGGQDHNSGFYSEESGDLPAAALQFLNGREASDKPRLWPLRRSVSLVGAGPACNVQLRHDSVSKVHSSLVLTPAGLWVVDLLGRHGTRVNGAPVRSARLHNGDELQIGRFRMAVRLDSSRTTKWCDSPNRTITTRSVVPAARTQTPDRASAGQPASVAPDRDDEAPTEPSPHTALAKNRSARATSPHADLSVPKPANGRAAPSERTYSEAFILRLMDQFAAMQQQAMIQSQQQMMMMVQLFNSMHHSQQELIREELARVHEINRHLQELQSELVRQQAAQHLTQRATPAATAPNEHSPVPPFPTQPGNAERTDLSAGSVNTAPAEPTVAAPETSAAFPDVRGGSAAVPVADETAQTDDDLSDVVPLDEPGLDEPELDEPGLDEPGLGEPAVDEFPLDKSAGDADRPGDPSTLHHPDADAHAWLAEQIHQLEREREGRWRKVLRMVGAGRL